MSIVTALGGLLEYRSAVVITVVVMILYVIFGTDLIIKDTHYSIQSGNFLLQDVDGWNVKLPTALLLTPPFHVDLTLDKKAASLAEAASAGSVGSAGKERPVYLFGMASGDLLSQVATTPGAPPLAGAPPGTKVTSLCLRTVPRRGSNASTSPNVSNVSNVSKLAVGVRFHSDRLASLSDDTDGSGATQTPPSFDWPTSGKLRITATRTGQLQVEDTERSKILHTSDAPPSSFPLVVTNLRTSGVSFVEISAGSGGGSGGSTTASGRVVFRAKVDSFFKSSDLI